MEGRQDPYAHQRVALGAPHIAPGVNPECHEGASPCYWGSTLEATGYEVDMNPVAGAFAWWDSFENKGYPAVRRMGHVAAVLSENADGTVTLERYTGATVAGNLEKSSYSTTTLPAWVVIGYRHDAHLQQQVHDFSIIDWAHEHRALSAITGLVAPRGHGDGHCQAHRPAGIGERCPVGVLVDLYGFGIVLACRQHLRAGPCVLARGRNHSRAGGRSPSPSRSPQRPSHQLWRTRRRSRS